MTTGWICARCGNSNSPQLLVCGCSDGTASTAATIAADSSKAPQQTVAEKKAVASRTSTTKSRYEYKDPAFQQFWEVYPLKRGKAAAYRKFIAAVDAGVTADRIIAAAAAYRDDERRDPLFTKWPEGWLTAGRWDDELEVAAAQHRPADPAWIVGTPEWDVRVHAEEDAAILRSMEDA